MSSKTLTAAVAGFVVLFLLGFVFYGLLLMNFFAANAGTATGVMKDSPDWLWLVIGEFLGALTLATIFAWAGVRSAAEGMRKGAVLGLLIGFAVAFSMYATANISTLASSVVDGLVQTVRFACAGAVIGMMLGRGPAA